MSSECLILSALKFSRSPYLDTHLSESEHGHAVRWAFIPCHRTPGSMPVDGATGSKSSTCSKCGRSVLNFSRSSYLDNHLISESIHARTKGTL